MPTSSDLVISASHHVIGELPAPHRAVEFARAEGLQMVEFFGNEFTTRQLGQIRRAASREGIKVAWHPWINLAGLKWAREIGDCLEEIVEDASRMGARNIVIHMGEADPRERTTSLAAVCEGFRIASTAAVGAGVRFCVENEPEYMMGVLGVASEDFALLFSATESQAVGFTLDTGHALITGGVKHWIDAAGARLAHVHLDSNDGKEDTHMGYPRGKLDWEGTIKALIRTGFRGPFNIEFEYADGGRELCDLLRRLAESQ